MICYTCKKDYEYFTHSECKLCGFKKRNKEKYNKVLEDGFWTEEELDIVLYQLFYAKPKIINGIELLLNKKSLPDLVELLRRKLPVGGQISQKIEIGYHNTNLHEKKNIWKEIIYFFLFFFKKEMHCKHCNNKTIGNLKRK